MTYNQNIVIGNKMPPSIAVDRRSSGASSYPARTFFLLRCVSQKTYAPPMHAPHAVPSSGSSPTPVFPKSEGLANVLEKRGR